MHTGFITYLSEVALLEFLAAAGKRTVFLFFIFNK